MKMRRFFIGILSLCLLSYSSLLAQSPVTFNSVPEICSNSDVLHLNNYVSPSGGVWSYQGAGFVPPDNFIPKDAGSGTHWIIYEYTDPSTQLTYKDSVEVLIRPEPLIEISGDTIYRFDELYKGSVSLENADGLLWYKKDREASGNFSGSVKSSNSYYNPGIDDIIRSYFCLFTMTTHNDNVCSSAHDSFKVYIPNIPNADFWSEIVEGSSPLTVQFHDTSYVNLFSLEYTWDFGDGTTSTEQNPKHTYSESGSFTVMLTVTNVVGSFDFERKIDFINVITLGMFEDKLNESLNIYPNPAIDHSVISINEKNSIKSVQLYNSTGQLIKEYSNLDCNELVIENQIAGIYFAQIRLKTGETINSTIMFK